MLRCQAGFSLSYRSLIGIREHPKYFIVQNLDLSKQAIMQEAAKLVTAGILKHPEEVFWFSLEEIKEIIETQQADHNVIARRKEKFQHDAKLNPPRAITSEGEIITAKEYGIPAVVAVDNATKILKDGQYIRVDGTKGFVEVLEEKEEPKLVF